MKEDKNMEQQILEAAEELFLQQGFASTTTNQIAQKAGCNKALVHYYYRTKDKLFDKIFEKNATLLIANLLNVNIEGVAFTERLARGIRNHFDFLRNNDKLPNFLYNELSTNPKRIESLKEKIQHLPMNLIEEIGTALQAEIEKGNIRPISIIDLLLTIISLNVMPFLFKPVLQSAIEIDARQLDLMLEKRKEEIVETVLARLKP